jgi:hypothetical protein
MGFLGPFLRTLRPASLASTFADTWASVPPVYQRNSFKHP